ncbi:MAG: Clp protease ClpP [Lachnospiraceae bacterium]|nr:Clp protease ClpP [Lachnospiraceae bacterium]
MKYRINIKGNIVPNNYAWYYRWFDEDCACPNDVSGVLDKLTDEDEVEVFINSPGGIIDAGTEIYTLLRAAAKNHDIKIYITGQACSAASVIACAAYCEMAPTASMMVHCVSSGASGNHSIMEHTAEMLRTADKALCTAYMAKAGMTENEALAMMENETWLNAEQAKEKGLIDAIMFEEEEEIPMVAGSLFKLPSEEQMNKIRTAMKVEQDLKEANEKAMAECKKKLTQLKLSGIRLATI